MYAFLFSYMICTICTGGAINCYPLLQNPFYSRTSLVFCLDLHCKGSFTEFVIIKRKIWRRFRFWYDLWEPVTKRTSACLWQLHNASLKQYGQFLFKLRIICDRRGNFKRFTYECASLGYVVNPTRTKFTSLTHTFFTSNLWF